MTHAHNYWIIFLTMSITLAYALPEDSQKLIHIDAHSTEFNYKTGVDVYEGNVIINQGSTYLNADKVVTTKNARHQIISAVAYGLNHEAEYTTIPKLGDEPLHAKAKIIKYYPETSLIFLVDNVNITQGKNSFQGPYIIYNMKAQTISAPATNKGRAHIIIEPKQLK